MNHTGFPRTPLVERAYELARSGDCRDPADIDICLVAEGYYLGTHLERAALKKDLLRVCHQARNESSPRGKK
jgi:hypothetical protein